MDWFYNVSIRAKLLSCFTLMAIIAAAIGTVGTLSITAIDEGDTALYGNMTVPIAQLGRVAVDYQRTRTNIAGMAAARTDEERRALKDTILALRQAIANNAADVRKTTLSKEAEEAAAEMLECRNIVDPIHDRIIALAERNRRAEASALLNGAGNTAGMKYKDAIDRLIALKVRHAGEQSTANTARGKAASTLMIVLSIAGFLLAIGTGAFISGIVTKPLARGVSMMQEFNLGKLSARLHIHRKDEIGELARAMDSFADSLQNGVVGTMKKIANGDVSMTIEPRDRDDEIGPALHGMIVSVRSLAADAKYLADAALMGRLSIRADAAKHSGEFRTIVEGVNDTLDAVVGPLRDVGAVMANMMEGDFTARITANYHGDFDLLKKDINALGVSLQQTVEDVGAVLNEMAGGDMTSRITSEYKGNFLTIKDSINQLGTALENALIEVADVVSSTAGAAAEISSNAEEMAAGAREQTSQAAEVAAAVEQMSHTILENSKNAAAAADTAERSKESAEAGGNVVQETVKGMERIATVVRTSAETVRVLGTSSDEIGEITGVIDDIANQTNLLALNAAIEAARAGDQGRGFAVVADEVRKLAERTTRATKEIAGMIKQIQHETSGAVKSMEQGTHEVDAGISLVDEAGRSLREIVETSQHVTDMVTQIAAASAEQSAASEQISKNVESISTVTAQTATGTQQVAQAAEDLKRLTAQLHDLVGRFKLSQSGTNMTPGERRKSDPGTKRRSEIAVSKNGRLTTREV